MLDLQILLGLRLEELRRAANLTRDQLARKTDIDPRTIASYELQGTYPKPKMLSKIRAALDSEFKDLTLEFRDIFDFTETRMLATISLEERLRKRSTERSDKGTTRRRSPKNPEQPEGDEGE